MAPVEKAEIDLTADEEHGVADYLAGEAGRHRPLQPPACEENIGGIDRLPDELDQKSRPGVAGARDTVEIYVGDGGHEQCRCDYPKRGNSLFDESSVVSVNGEHAVWEKQHDKGAHDGEYEADEGDASDDERNLV